MQGGRGGSNSSLIPGKSLLDESLHDTETTHAAEPGASPSTVWHLMKEHASEKDFAYMSIRRAIVLGGVKVGMTFSRGF